VFQTIVREQSLSDLEVYNSEVTYGAISVEGDSAYVETQTTYKGTRTPVEYDLHRTDSTWVADDIVVNDVSTAGGYARSFQTVMRKRGFDALMQSLERKREQVLSRSASSSEG
jgi:phospholipid transport system substrate-binding protein